MTDTQKDTSNKAKFAEIVNLVRERYENDPEALGRAVGKAIAQIGTRVYLHRRMMRAARRGDVAMTVVYSAALVRLTILSSAEKITRELSTTDDDHSLSTEQQVNEAFAAAAAQRAAGNYAANARPRPNPYGNLS